MSENKKKPSQGIFKLTSLSCSKLRKFIWKSEPHHNGLKKIIHQDRLFSDEAVRLQSLCILALHEESGGRKLNTNLEKVLTCSAVI